MTCLYCGKKLGFFSRYKDTPFCSEEHLRTHQDELEQALMERLGSKSIITPARSLNDLVNAEAAPTKSLLGLEAATRAPEAKPQAQQPEPQKQTKKLPKVVEEAPKAPAPPPANPPPAPLHEEFLFQLPDAVAALSIETPLVPPASFAIIVQADCCTPSSPDHRNDFTFSLDVTEFEIDASSLVNTVTFIPPPQPNAFNEEGFGEPWVEFPTATEANLQLPFDLVVSSNPLPLEYEAVSTTLHHTALGQREEIEPRLRLRFPYAASQVTSSWNTLLSTELSFSITSADEWDPILPFSTPKLQIQSAPVAPTELSPFLDVPLTISAMTRLNLDAADAEDFGDSLAVFAQSLSANAALAADCAASYWAPTVALPRPAINLTVRPSWQPSRSADRVPPVPFPSLFQLGPVLPPRSESSAG